MGSVTTTELAELLRLLCEEQRFVEYMFRVDRHGPEVVAFVREWPIPTAGPRVADVVMLFDENLAGAFRTVIGPGDDVFAPELVSWSYLAAPVWTLRAMIALPAPGHPDEPSVVGAPPAICVLPKEGRMPVTVRMRRRW